MKDSPQFVESTPEARAGIGHTLANGGVILKEVILRQFSYRRDSMVLCIIPNKRWEPFAIWHRLITSDSPLATGGYQVVETTTWGHYFRTLDEALEKFDIMSEEKVALMEEYTS